MTNTPTPPFEIGQRVLLAEDGLTWPVVVLSLAQHFGRWDITVTPTGGSGERTVSAAKLRAVEPTQPTT